MNKRSDKIIDSFMDLFYSKNKTKLCVLMLALIGFILRIISARNIGISADDAVHAIRPIGIIESGKMVELGQSSAMWYYIQEIFYKIFGATQIGSRFASALFGAALIILIYLFVKQIFKSEKIGLIASALITFSPFLIKMTLPEMDIVVMFFVIFSGLFIFRFNESYKNKDLFFAGFLMGIAVLIKVYSLFFVGTYCIFLIYKGVKKKKINKRFIKGILIFGFTIFIFTVPTLTHNYLLYKDKGFMDLIFTNVFKLGLEKAEELYSWGAGWMPHTDYKGFFLGNQVNFQENPETIYRLPGFIVLLYLSFMEDPILILFGLLGFIYLILKKHENYLSFFIITFFVPFIYLGSHIPMLKHFTFIFVLLVPISSYFIYNLGTDIIKKNKKIKWKYLLILLILINLLWLGKGVDGLNSHFYSESGEGQLINYKNQVITEDSLVVVDSRIFRGFIGWLFNDRFYLESNYFGAALEQSAQYGDPVPLEVYYVECAKDDCGWGTIKNQPEFNKTMEELTTWFSNNSELIKEIKAVNRYEYYFPFITSNKEEPIYRVYRSTLMVNPSILLIAKSTHNVLMYPIGYDETIGPVFDEYQVYSAFDGLLDKTAHIILKTGWIFSFISLGFLIYLFIKEDDEDIKEIKESKNEVNHSNSSL